MRSVHQDKTEQLILKKQFHNFRKLNPKSSWTFFTVLLKGVPYEQTTSICVYSPIRTTAAKHNTEGMGLSRESPARSRTWS